MLRATNLERNVNRSWVCRIERDLFGACVVSVTLGRAGTHGRTIRGMVLDDAAADRFLASALLRRKGSSKRCGAAIASSRRTALTAVIQRSRVSCAKDRDPQGRDPKGLGGAKRNRATVPAQPGDAELLSSGSHEMRFDTSRSNSEFWFSSRTALSIPLSKWLTWVGCGRGSSKRSDNLIPSGSGCSSAVGS